MRAVTAALALALCVSALFAKDKGKDLNWQT
jgi:hypothetical protein